MNKPNYFVYIFVGLMVFGILMQFTANPLGLIIPLLVFGAIFYLLRFPAGSRNWWPFKQSNPFKKDRKSNFTVFTNQSIPRKDEHPRANGSPRKEEDDDQRPNRFH
jgi:hypothetical protein